MDVKRGTRGRKRGRGRGRGKKGKIVSSDEEATMETTETQEKENEIITEEIIMAEEEEVPIVSSEAPVEQAKPILPVPAPTPIDMEADISQLEAPTFTTLSRGPPEPMLRLKWSHKVNLIGEKVLNPMIHCCDQCEKPILVYGRMIPCKHIFCLKCARREPIKICPRCNDKVIRVEQSGLGTVFLCTHGGSRYGNTGCRRTYLSQRDLQAHINHRHIAPLALSQQPNGSSSVSSTLDSKQDSHLDSHKLAGSTRKLSESSTGGSSSLLTPRTQSRTTGSSIGNIPAPGAATPTTTHSNSALTAANLARINNANAQECHQGKERLHQTLKKTPIQQSNVQPTETEIADASYYSSVLNSFK